jgi:hypothetical protein
MSSSSYFVANSGLRIAIPVTFPPGLASLPTSCAKLPPAITIIGIVAVTRCATVAGNERSHARTSDEHHPFPHPHRGDANPRRAALAQIGFR